MTVLPQEIRRFDAIPVKTAARKFFFFFSDRHLILKFIWKGSGHRRAENDLDKEQSGEIALLNIKAYCTVTVRTVGVGIGIDTQVNGMKQGTRDRPTQICTI